MHSQGAGTARDTEKCSGQASCRQFPSADLHLLGDLLGQSRALPGQGLLGTKSFLFQALGLQLPPKSGSPNSKLSSMTLKSMQDCSPVNWREDKGNFWGTAYRNLLVLPKTKAWPFLLKIFQWHGRGGEPQRSHPHSGPWWGAGVKRTRRLKLLDSHLIHNLRKIPAWQDLHLPTQKGSIYPVYKAFGWQDLQ